MTSAVTTEEVASWESTVVVATLGGFISGQDDAESRAAGIQEL